ncbi:MAG: nodulation protein NfeD [Elusimicrobia bacterium]|nr:nodulation protein NfeD [Elusimicrobiota bacterium]
MGLAAALLSAALAAPAPAGSAPAPKVLAASFSGVISPVAAEFFVQSLRRAEEGGYDAFVFELDTPGGLDPSMREMVKAELSSRVPVVVYVQPTGARAASAGVFIAMAAHVAAMAPGTNIGAAHPVTIGMGGDKGKEDPVMGEKLANDAAAYLKSIAQTRGRNADWAFEAVAKSTSIPASEAAARGVVDFVAADLAEVLRRADGRRVHGLEAPLRTAGASVERVTMSRRPRWLAVLSDPNVAMVLMSLGAGGLMIELYNPGLILPGIVGLVSLLLAFYSFQTLSASYAGVLLLMAGMLFFLLEIKVTSYGLLALGGTAATVLGMLMLFQQPLGGLGVAWEVIAGTVAGLLGVTGLCAFLVYGAFRRKVATGAGTMVGMTGRALSDLSPEGKVAVGGEVWDAVCDAPVRIEAEVVVTAVEGMRLKVRPRA